MIKATLNENEMTDEDMSALIASVRYDAQRGALFWEYRDWLGQRGNIYAGKQTSQIAVTVKLATGSFKFRTDRLIWFFETGKFPRSHLQPINGDWRDLRFSNLEEVSVRVIRRRRSGWGKSGKGVCVGKGGRWQYQLKVDGIVVGQGYAASQEEAAERRAELERQYWGNIR